MQTSTQPVDVFFNLFTALFDAVGLMICLFFLLVAFAVFIWWLYSNFFSAAAHATIVGIRACKKDTSIEDGTEVKVKPYAMYSPLLLCKLGSGTVVNGKLSSSQSWIPEKWIIGSKVKVIQTSDTENFNETAGYLLLLTSLAIGFSACAFAYSIKINIYTIAILGIFLLQFLFNIYRRGLLRKFYDFIIHSRWKELKNRFPADRKAFFKRKKEEEKNTNWHKLSPEEISQVLKKQYNSFFRSTLPFMLFSSIGMLATAYYKFGKKFIPLYMDNLSIFDIAHANPAEFAITATLTVFGVFTFLQITAKSIRLLRKKHSPQPLIF